MPTEPTSVPVWDRFVRFAHWFLVAAFTTAYFSGGEFMPLHEIAGWCVLGTVLSRVAWGFIGPRHARFSDFVHGPRAAFAYLRGLWRGSAPRSLGHNAAGGLMVVALLLSLGATTFSGLLLQGADEHEGPFAAWFAAPQAAPETAQDEAAGEEAEDVWEEVHEFFVNLTLTLIALHLLGVAASSLAHHENLPRAMLTGRKRQAERP